VKKGENCLFCIDTIWDGGAQKEISQSQKSEKKYSGIVVVKGRVSQDAHQEGKE